VLLDKLLTADVLRGAGFPTVPNRAVLGRATATKGVVNLRDANDISQFLLDQKTPIFCKPNFGSRSLGTCRIEGVVPDGKTLRFSTGATALADEFAAEVLQKYPSGHLSQDPQDLHPDLVKYAGPTGATLRVVTLRKAISITCLYALQKLPAPGAIVDGSGAGKAAYSIAWLDPETGAVKRAQDLTRLPQPLEKSIVTGLPFADAVIPNVPQAVDICCRAHARFPSHGMLGFDILSTRDGPRINEINANPLHSLYQRASDRGLFADEMKSQLDDAQTETIRVLEQFDAESNIN